MAGVERALSCVLCDRANPATALPPVFAPMPFLTLVLCSSCPPAPLLGGGLGQDVVGYGGHREEVMGQWIKANLQRVLQVCLGC